MDGDAPPAGMEGNRKYHLDNDIKMSNLLKTTGRWRPDQEVKHVLFLVVIPEEINKFLEKLETADGLFEFDEPGDLDALKPHAEAIRTGLYKKHLRVTVVQVAKSQAFAGRPFS